MNEEALGAAFRFVVKDISTKLSIINENKEKTGVSVDKQMY